MKIVYLIRAHRGPEQVARLVDVLRAEGVSFFIHIDGKVDEAPFRQALERRGRMDDIRFAARRVKMTWGDYSQVEATLSCMREVLAGFPDGEPDRIFLMSGQDYPLVSNREIADFMARHPDTEFISYGAMPPAFWNVSQMRRVERYHFYGWTPLVWPAVVTRRMTYRQRIVTKLVNWLLPKRSLPDGFKPYGGSAWWCLTGAGARRMLALSDANPKLRRFCKYTLHTEEMYFQTLLLNSDMDPARIRGEYLGKDLGDYLWFVDWHGQASPRTFRAEDLDVLLASNRMFARKFDTDTDSQILDLLDDARQTHTLREWTD